MTGNISLDGRAGYGAVIVVHGPAARRFLSDQLSVSLPEAGKGRYGLLLNEKGRILSDGFVWCYDDRHYLWCVDNARLDSSGRALARKLGADRDQVNLGIAQDLYSGSAPTALAEAWSIVDSRHASLGYRLISQTPIAADSDYLARRLALGLPETADLPEGKALPAEYGLDALAIDFDKGCFIGQEVCARLRHLGVRKSTVVPIQYDHTRATLETGKSLRLAGKPVAEVISVYQPPLASSLDAPLADPLPALAFVRLSLERVAQIPELEWADEGGSTPVGALPVAQNAWR